MSIWGKILGGAAGFALGGPLGALAGTAAGHAVDRFAAPAPPEGPESRENTRKIAFTVGVIALGAKMAKADGVVTRDEVDAFKRVFRVPAEEEANVAKVFDRARKASAGFEVYARQIELLQCLMEIARADGTIHDTERAYLAEIARLFGIAEADWRRLEAIELGEGAADPYSVLGVAPDAADADIKAAYRQLVRENHPDTLVAQGLPAEFVEVADRKLAAINAAYAEVKAQRGLR
jgi:DnaJ like chaperone protein